MNSVILIGRLTRDPELRWSGETAIARFSIAIDRPMKRDGSHETDFPSIVVFGKIAENCDRYLSKGRQVAVEGRIQTGNYINKNGDKVYTTEVVANRVEFLNSGNGKRQQGQQGPGSQAQQSMQPEEVPAGFEPVSDDIPF